MKFRKYLPEIGIIILAILVRLIQLDGSFWLDEAAQALESIRPLSKQFEIAADFQPPLFHLIVHALIQLSQTEWWLRLASLIPGLLTIWLTIKIGKRLFNRGVGLAAGILLATSQFHLLYSQELRPYSLAALFGLITFWYWLDVVDAKSKNHLKFILAGIAGLYSMYVFPAFLLALLIITGIFYKKKFIPVLKNTAVMALAFVPWLPAFLEQVSIGTSLAAAKPLWASIVSPPVIKMLPLVYLKFLFGRVPFDPTPFSLVTIAVISISLLAAFNRVRKSRQGMVVILLALLPPLIAFLISLFVPVLDPKRVLFSLPFLYLGLAAGLGKRAGSALILIIFLTINMTAIRQYATDPEVQREPWREAVTILEADAPDDTLLVFAFAGPFAPWDWYQARNLETLSVTDPKTMPPVNNQHVVLFDYLKPMYDPDDQIMANLDNQGFSETGFYQYPGIGKIRVYAR
jgi:mannosyltransferase